MAVASTPTEQRDTLAAGELSPRDVTGSVTAWDAAYGADALFRPRIVRLNASTIGIRLLRPAHVAVILGNRCGPYAAVPGRDLTARVPAGEQYLTLGQPFRGGCPPNFWRPIVTVIASELPMHGEVLEERAQSARGVEELMLGRQDAWAAYAVYTTRLP